jgi:hypothetical protein
MSLLGDLLGYDNNGHDILGENRECEKNCPVCGVSAYLHTREMEGRCLQKLYGGRKP